MHNVYNMNRVTMLTFERTFLNIVLTFHLSIGKNFENVQVSIVAIIPDVASQVL